jgi:hypothetical protein
VTDATPPVAQPETAAGSFLAKLREQSFSILVMVAVVYYQHTLWQADRARMELELTRREAQVDAMVEAERSRLVEREKYLINQRDQFIDMLKEQAAVCRLKARAVDE